ncbi:toxin glutamine deamidase domain-containing protein [Streptomyces sp. NPDC059122]|uniref:toxin glutamine deamidase domain-containing protein n=1 Tax=Streptomyces sp. NPDC059122 TaxID=3346732 RepID=UPI00369D0F45
MPTGGGVPTGGVPHAGSSGHGSSGSSSGVPHQPAPHRPDEGGPVTVETESATLAPPPPSGLTQTGPSGGDAPGTSGPTGTPSSSGQHAPPPGVMMGGGVPPTGAPTAGGHGSATPPRSSGTSAGSGGAPSRHTPGSDPRNTPQAGQSSRPRPTTPRPDPSPRTERPQDGQPSARPSRPAQQPLQAHDGPPASAKPNPSSASDHDAPTADNTPKPAHDQTPDGGQQSHNPPKTDANTPTPDDGPKSETNPPKADETPTPEGDAPKPEDKTSKTDDTPNAEDNHPKADDGPDKNAQPKDDGPDKNADPKADGSPKDDGHESDDKADGKSDSDPKSEDAPKPEGDQTPDKNDKNDKNEESGPAKDEQPDHSPEPDHSENSPESDQSDHSDQKDHPDQSQESDHPDQSEHGDQPDSDGTDKHDDRPSLDEIRSGIQEAPGGLEPPHAADQQALENSVPRNDDGTPQRFPDPTGDWAKLQNDGGTDVPGRSNNCADCSRSFLETWYGNPQVSAPRTPDVNPDGTPDRWSPENKANENIIDWAGASHSYAGTSPDGHHAIAQDLLNAGPGSSAIVQVNWADGGGHAFNAVNHDGKVVWVDTQSGEVSHQPINTDGATDVFYIPLDADRNPLHQAPDPSHDSDSDSSYSQSDNGSHDGASTHDAPGADHPKSDQPKSDQPKSDQPKGDQPEASDPSAKRKAEDQPSHDGRTADPVSDSDPHKRTKMEVDDDGRSGQQSVGNGQNNTPSPPQTLSGSLPDHLNALNLDDSMNVDSPAHQPPSQHGPPTGEHGTGHDGQSGSGTPMDVDSQPHAGQSDGNGHGSTTPDHDQTSTSTTDSKNDDNKTGPTADDKGTGKHDTGTDHKDAAGPAPKDNQNDTKDSTKDTPKADDKQDGQQDDKQKGKETQGEGSNDAKSDSKSNADHPYSDPKDRGDSDTAQQEKDGKHTLDREDGHSKEYGKEPDAEQQKLRERQTLDVHRIPLDRVHTDLTRWADDGHLAQVFRASSGHADSGPDAGKGPQKFTESDLEKRLPGFKDLERGEKLAVVSSLARMSGGFHEQHGVGQNPVEVKHPYRNPNEAAPADGTKDSGAKNAEESLGARGHRNSGNKVLENLKLTDSAPDSLKKNTPDFSDRNYAVLEVKGPPPDNQVHYVADSSVPVGEKNVSGRHSEKHLLDWLDRANKEGTKYTANALYTEREPCGKGQGHAHCSDTLRKMMPDGSKVYYSTTYRTDPEDVQAKKDIDKEKAKVKKDVAKMSHADVQKEAKERLDRRTDHTQQWIDREKSKIDGSNDADARKELKKMIDAEYKKRKDESTTPEKQAMTREMDRHIEHLNSTWKKIQPSLM